MRLGLSELVTLPVRLTVAATDTTLGLGQLMAPDGPIRRPGGYAERIVLIIGEGGLIERLSAVLSDPKGPMSLVNTLAAATAEDRPLGRAMAPGGTLDRLLAEDGPLYRILQEGGALDQLFAAEGPLERLLSAGGALDRITREGGVLDRLLQEEGLLDRLLTEDGFVEKLVAEGGTLDQLVALGATLEQMLPRLAELGDIIPELHSSVDTLNQAVEPLGVLAGRLPRPRRRGEVES